ncbi:MAG: glycosyltransferase [Ruminococcus sp.]|nr:glycosyltransferase [Ruminococcus sp.]
MKVLHIVAGLDTGGVAMLLYQYYSVIYTRGVVFDFVVHEDSKLEGRRGRFESKFEELGSTIYRVSPKKEGLSKNLKQVEEIMVSGSYAAVHVHNEETSALYTMMAKRLGIPTRIVHAHYAYKKYSFQRKIYSNIMKMLIKYSATNWLACSQDAGIAMYGEKGIQSPKFKVIHNAMDLSKFEFSSSIRCQVREELGIEDNEFVIIDVGRLTYQKNPQFMIEVFHSIYEKRHQSKLLMVGIGELEDDTKDIVAKYGMEDKVVFLGMRNDVNLLLQAADAFVLPSRFEGLGIVYVEAQATGLPTFATKENVPAEAKVCDNLEFISEKCTADEWADMILRKVVDNKDSRHSPLQELVKAHFDINREADALLEIYKK